MPSVQRFLSGRDNLVRDALLTASNVRASSAAIERLSAARAGGGRVRLAGAYTGHEAAEVQVEIVADGGVPRASVPQFVGVGNGQLQVLAVDAAAPLQALTLTLADLGVATAHAGLDVRELRLRARTPGAAGNALRVTVQPRLTRTPTAWALLADWPAGAATQTGVQWDFGGLPLNAQQELDAASPRIQFGADPQVYRPWRRYQEGVWQFGLSPQLERGVAAGTPVLAVTGGYVVTVTDGVTSETFGDTAAAQPEIRTFHDLLLALADSALVEVAGVVAADRTVGGQAAIDVPLRTQAWLLAQSGGVTLQDVAVPATAPTQAVVVRCINDDVVGAERWSVAGDVSGVLPVATTGLPYTHAAIAFTVPRVEAAAAGSGRWSFKYQPVARDEDAGVPSVCLRPFRLGSNAVPRTVTFRYQKRPPADCKCTDMPTPRLSMKCLGLDGGADMALDAEYQTRLEALYQWRSEFVAGQGELGGLGEPASRWDMDICDALVNVFGAALAEVFESAPALVEWDAAFASVQAELEPLEGSSGTADDASEVHPGASFTAADIEQMARGYAARMDYVRTLAGIVPKSESSGSDAGSCWTDHGGSHWWADTEGYYLPAFTNEAYVSARRDTDTGTPYSTMEFGFGLVVACPERLVVGDEITVRIEAVDGERPYRVGDEAIIQTVGAGPAWLTGGVDGTDVQTWRVSGGASGALPDYLVPTDGGAVPDWVGAGLTLRMAPAGIGFALGDSFSLAVEAGQYRWRRAAGAWSAAADIPAAGVAALDDGLSVHFDPGAAPSFVPGDAYAFTVHQPWAVSHVRDAHASAWGWDGAGAALVLDFGAVRALGAIALARYQLPAGATVAAELSDDGLAWGAPLPLDVTGPVAVRLLAAAGRYLRLTVAGAPGGSIGWLWAGEPMATDHHASTCQRRRRWAVTRGEGPNAASLYAGAGDGWSLSWQPGDAQASRLLESDVARLVALLDWAQAQDEPLLFVPHHQHPGDAALVRFAADALEVTDLHQWQPDDAGGRQLSAALELEPVFA